MIDEADRDGDGEVNEQEFLRIMKKTSLYWNRILFIFARVYTFGRCLTFLQLSSFETAENIGQLFWFFKCMILNLCLGTVTNC